MRGSKRVNTVCGPSCLDSELSWLEVAGSLGNSEALEVLLVLGQSSSGGLGGVLPSQVEGGSLALLVLLLGGVSALFVDHGQHSGDGLSSNL